MATVAWLVLSCLVLQTQVKGEDLQNEELSPRIRCPQNSFIYNNCCYTFFMSPKSWMEASLECQNLPSGNLVSVLTRSEANFLAALISESNTIASLIWIGLHDYTEGLFRNGWEWITKDWMDYVAWEYGVPTGSGYCGTVSYRSDYKKWQDFNCRNLLPYVCKFEI